MQQGFLLHAVSSLIAALVTTAVSLPVDIVKTRYQNMKITQGKPEYSGILVSYYLVILVSTCKASCLFNKYNLVIRKL
jgi:solute carrier family 25 oxoglutarate transporter 11